MIIFYSLSCSSRGRNEDRNQPHGPLKSFLCCSKDYTRCFIARIYHLPGLNPSNAISCLFRCPCFLFIPPRTCASAPSPSSQMVGKSLCCSSLHTVLPWRDKSPFSYKTAQRQKTGLWPSLYSHGLLKSCLAHRPLINVFQIDGWLPLEFLALPTCWLASVGFILSCMGTSIISTSVF